MGGNLGSVSNSYATGSVSGTGNSVGGLVGGDHLSGTSSTSSRGTSTNSFWNTTTSGQATSAGGTGMTSAQMQQQINFNSWDFANTWIVYNGSTSPLLQSFMTPLTVTANNATKTYDGLTYSGGNGVTYSSTPNGNLLGTVSYSGTSQGAKNAGSYAITPGGLYSNQQGYIISYGDGSLTVNQSSVNLTGSRIYDGTTSVSSGIFTLGNLLSGETLTLSGSGSVASKNVSAGTPVMLGTLALGDGIGGLASNYTFTGGTQTANITAKALTVSGVTAGNKVYDGSTTATLGGTAAVAAMSGDAVTVGGTGSGAFANKNAGAGKAVTVSGFTLGGADAGNYSVVQPAGLTANVTPAQLTYTATPASFLAGQTPGSLSGTVDGFVTGDTLANSATGPLAWTTTAGPTSQPGQYPINGGGLLAINYVFAQAVGNATALTLKPGTAPEPVRNATTQLESHVLPPGASTQAEALSLSPAITVTQRSSADTVAGGDASSSGSGNGAVVNTTISIGRMGPALQIVNGGMRLPGNMVNVNE